MSKTLFLFIAILISSFAVENAYGQGVFFLQEGRNDDKIKVNIVNNLVIVPVTVNGTELSFLLDTGAVSTVIFEIEANEELTANETSYTTLMGAGSGEPVTAISSKGNEIKIGNAVSKNEPIYIILDEKLDFSPQLGAPVQGIIGYQLFKDFIVEINYSKSYIKLYKPATFTYDECSSCTYSTLQIKNKRPLIDLQITQNEEASKVSLLLDSGMGDALWLLPDPETSITAPTTYFEDYLGMGLNGSIYGKRSRVSSITLDRFQLASVTTSFPDSLSLKNIQSSGNRNGSLGAELLRRFNVIVDYPNEKIRLKKNRYFDEPFNYNKSGITVQHGAYTLSKELLSSNDRTISRANEYTSQIVNLFKSVNKYRTTLLPTYEVMDIRKDSSAEHVGIQKGDLIISINGRSTEKMTLEELTNYFYRDDGEQLRLVIERNGIEFKKTIVLTPILPKKPL